MTAHPAPMLNVSRDRLVRTVAIGDAPSSAEQVRHACAHCSLPVPAGLVVEGSAQQFCCHGCATAYSVISSCNLQAYYDLLERTSGERGPARVSRRAYGEFDDPTFHALYCRPVKDRAAQASDASSGLLRTELLLEGVHCAACVWLVEKLPQVLPGVAEARLDLRRASVSVTFDPAQVRLSRIARMLDSLGYCPHPARASGSGGAGAGMGGSMTVRDVRRIEDRRLLIQMAVAGACAGNIMLLFVAMYAGMFQGIERAHDQFFRWASLGLTLICLAWPGQVFLRSALAAVRMRTIHLDVPIALGLYLGGAWGMYKTIAGSGDLYFDSITALIFFLLVGRYVQRRQQRSAADAVELLFSVTPSVARKVETDDPAHTREVPVEALAIGDLVEVRAGDCVPVDGVVELGQADLDVALLTGESRPVRVGSGMDVVAGAVNLSGVLRVRVRAVGEDTRIGTLMRTVEEASRRRARIVQLADRWAGWLLAALLALAGLTLAIWWRESPTVAIDRAAALLIAVCPCGLGLATPLAMTVSIGRAAGRGVLIKGADAVQALADARDRGLIVLDKTGTVTTGRLSLVRFEGAEWVKPLVCALEAGSSHPTARALERDLSAGSAVASRIRCAPERVVQHQGAGIEGVVDGRPILVGTEEFLRSGGVRVDDAWSHRASRCTSEGLSPVFVACDGVCVAVAALGDPVRPDARRVIDALRARGYALRMLSGDHPDVVRRVGAQLGLSPEECLGGITPEGKLRVVRQELQTRPVIVVGDGVNDAAALAASTVGIAVRGGAEASLAAADVSLSREGLSPVLELIDGAGRTLRTIHWTIAASIAYNVLAAALAVAGLISPLLAAIIMPASSFTVVAICLQSGAFRGPRPVASRGPAEGAITMEAGR